MRKDMTGKEALAEVIAGHSIYIDDRCCGFDERLAEEKAAEALETYIAELEADRELLRAYGAAKLRERDSQCYNEREAIYHRALELAGER